MENPFGGFDPYLVFHQNLEMRWSEIIRDYCTFTRKERIGLIFVLLLIILVFILPFFLNKNNVSNITTNDTAWISAVKASKAAGNNIENDIDNNETIVYQFDTSRVSTTRRSEAKLFRFDPNTLPVSGWRQLGVRDKTIQTIMNYRNKGGSFKSAEDLQRIYGLPGKDYERLAPFVTIHSNPGEKIPAAINSELKSQDEELPASYFVLDINTADTSAFIRLPGIGSKLAARIVNFRNKLGGFYSIQQVGETFGLPDSTFQRIKPYLRADDTIVKKFDVNTASVDELKTHPYIKWQIANAIIAYRQEHGPFTKIEDIRKIMVISGDDYKRIVPYLALQ